MFSLIRGLLFLLICFVGVGIYRGWFTLSAPSHDAQSSKVNITVGVDGKKVKADVQKFEQKLTQEIAEHAQPAGAQAPATK